MKKNIGPSFCNMSSQDRICPIVYSKLEAVGNHYPPTAHNRVYSAKHDKAFGRQQEAAHSTQRKLQLRCVHTDRER